MQQGIHGKPSWAGTLSVSQSGAFSYCVTRFRGGALRHAKFPKTSYKVQLLDTLKHGRCVSLNHRRRRDLIFLSGKVLVLSWAKRRRFVGRGTPSHSHLSSSPKSPDGYRFAILALTVKLWLAVPYARRKNASAFSALLVVFPSLPRNLLERNNIKTRRTAE